MFQVMFQRLVNHWLLYIFYNCSSVSSCLVRNVNKEKLCCLTMCQLCFWNFISQSYFVYSMKVVLTSSLKHTRLNMAWFVHSQKQDMHWLQICMPRNEQNWHLVRVKKASEVVIFLCRVQTGYVLAAKSYACYEMSTKFNKAKKKICKYCMERKVV